MKILKGKDYSQFYLNRYHRALKEKKYDDALDVVMRGYFIATDIGDEDCRQTFLNVAKEVVLEFIDMLRREATEEAEQGLCCSFCEKRANEVQLIKGWHGTICQDCVVQFYKILTEKD